MRTLLHRSYNSIATGLFNRFFYLAHQFLYLCGKGRDNLLEVPDDPKASLFEYIGLRILVYGDDVLGAGTPCQVLAGAGEGDSDVQRWSDDLSSEADLD